ACQAESARRARSSRGYAGNRPYIGEDRRQRDIQGGVLVMPRLDLIVKALPFAAVVLLATAAGAATTIVVVDWNNAALQEVRLSQALRNGPPMVARALAITHPC